MCAKRILTVGSTNIDFVLTTPYLPDPGETLRSGGEYSFMPGGKGANAAAAAAATARAGKTTTAALTEAFSTTLGRG